MKRIAIALSLLMLSFGVTASTVTPPGGETHWVYYAYGNTEAIAAFFNALAMIVGTSSFKSLCVALALGGFVASGAAGMISGNPRKFFGYIVGLLIFIYSIFSAKIDIHVKEMIYVPDTHMSGYMNVSNVPLAVGLPMVVISKVGQGINDLVNTYLTTPGGSDLLIKNGTLPFGAGMGIAQDMTKVRIANPYLRKNFNEWVGKCLAPRVFSGQVSMANIVDSPDIITTLSTTIAATSGTQFFKMTHLNGSTTNPSPLSGGTEINSNNGIVTCAEGFPILKDQLQHEIKGGIENIGAKLSPQIATAILDADKAGTIATGIAGAAMGSATNMATQGAVIDLMNGTSSYQAQILENDPALLALNLNNAQRSQKTGWYTASVLFRDMGGYFFAILQVFLIGVTPLVAAMMFVPGMGVKLGGSYIKACIWLASWWPSLQIVNFIMETYYQASANATFSPAGGLTMANVGLANQFNDNMIIAAGFMATLVPTVMWGIINGAGYALTSVLDRAAGSNYASSAAQDSAAGNFRAGNVGMNSFSANKFDNTIAYATGTRAAEAHYGTNATYERIDRGGATVSQYSGMVTKTDSTKESFAYEQAVAKQESAKDAFTSAAVSSIGRASSTLQSFNVTTSIAEDGRSGAMHGVSVDRDITTLAQMAHGYTSMIEQGHKEEAMSTLAAKLGISTGQLSQIIGANGSIEMKNSEGVSTGVSMKFDRSGRMTLQDSTGAQIMSNEQKARGEATQNGSAASTQFNYAETNDMKQVDTEQKSYETAKNKTDSAKSALDAATNTTVHQGVTQGDIADMDAKYKEIAGTANQNIKSISNDVEKAGGKDGTKGAVVGALAAGDIPIQNQQNFIDSATGNLVSKANDNLNQLEATITNESAKLHATQAQSRLAEVNKDNTQNYKDYVEAKHAIQQGLEQRKDDKMEQYKFLEDLAGKSSFVGTVAMSVLDYATGMTQSERAENFANGHYSTGDFMAANNGDAMLSSQNLANIKGFKIEGTTYTPSGVIGGFGGYDLQMVYRTGESKDDARYFAVTNDGKLSEISVDDPNSAKKGQETSQFTQGSVNMFDTYTQVGGEWKEGQDSSLGKNTYTATNTNYVDITPVSFNNIGGNSTEDSAVNTGKSRTGDANDIANSKNGSLKMELTDKTIQLAQAPYMDAVREAAHQGNPYAMETIRGITRDNNRNEALDIRGNK